jgi:Uma2 family endonuclease
MTQAITKHKIITYEEFVAWKPEGTSYELHDGVIFEMPQPLGEHENIGGFLTLELSAEIKRLNLPYTIPKQALVKPPQSESAYLPDVLILNRANLVNEELWKKQSTVTQGASVPLVIEVVSSNWRDDYYKKLADYEAMGVPEYWVVDYLALGARKFIGSPKQPTISIYKLIEGEYQVNLFQGSESIQSPTFPHLNLTPKQAFQAGIDERI